MPRLFVVLVALLAGAAEAQRGGGRFDRTNSRCAQGRSDRGLACDDGAFLEFAPASGAGMGTACACAAVTGAKGETLTFTRTGNATCSPLGLATTGITNASLVECAGNLPRVEASGGVLGLRVEAARVNVLTRFIDYANATWADVGTPALTGAQVSPWTGTYANLAVQFDDNDGAAFEGRTQTVTVTAATQYTMSCFVKAGTLTSARLSLDGTTADFTGLSSTTWTLATVVDASSSGVAIAAQVLNGSTAAATGTVVWGGCQVEAGGVATSMIPTVAAGVTRNIESPAFTLSSAVGPSASIAASAQWPSTAVGAVNYLALGNVGDNMTLYRTNDTGAGFQINATITSPAVSSMGTTVHRAALADASGTRSAFWDLGSVAAPAASMAAGVSTVWIGRNVGGTPADGIVTRVCIDPDPTRCR